MAQTAPEGAAQGGGGELEEIVITAQKRSQTIDKTSVAVTALSMDQLQTAGVTDIADLTSAVPDVQVHTIAAIGFTGLTIRGISNQDFSQLGSPAVATYVDGIYVATSQALSNGLFDIERMEVLRGPQGTTYGQNSTGGNINIVTADPKPVFGAYADVSYGNYNDVQSHFMVNIPINDQLAVRAAFESHRSDGYMSSEGTTGRNFAAADDFGARFTALWTPSDVFKWRLSVEGYGNQGTPGLLEQIGPNGQPADGRPPFSQPLLGPHAEPGISTHGYAIRSRMDLKFTDWLSLAYVAGYQKQDSTYTFNVAGATTAQESYDAYWIDRVTTYTNELDLNFDYGPIHNILGVSQLHTAHPYDRGFHFYAFDIDINDPNSNVNQASAGVFDQITYSVLDNFRLIAGIRRSYESENTGHSSTQTTCPIVAGANPATFSQIYAQTPTDPGCGATNTPYAKGVWYNTSWKGGMEWDITKDTMGYFTVTNGFKSGQVQPGLPPQFAPYVNPEQVVNYELGAKTRLLENRLNVRAAIFDERYSNVQVAQVTTVNNLFYNITENAAGARIYGAEFEAQYLPTEIDHVSGFFNYLHATYTHYHDGVDGETGDVIPSLDGNFLPNAPEFSARVQYSHDFVLPNGGTVSPMLAVYYQTYNFLREFNFPIDRQPAYTKTDLNITYEDPSKRWKVTAYGFNLENKYVREVGNTAASAYFSDYLPPRLFGIRASYTW